MARLTLWRLSSRRPTKKAKGPDHGHRLSRTISLVSSPALRRLELRTNLQRSTQVWFLVETSSGRPRDDIRPCPGRLNYPCFSWGQSLAHLPFHLQGTSTNNRVSTPRPVSPTHYKTSIDRSARAIPPSHRPTTVVSDMPQSLFRSHQHTIQLQRF